MSKDDQLLTGIDLIKTSNTIIAMKFYHLAVLMVAVCVSPSANADSEQGNLFDVIVGRIDRLSSFLAMIQIHGLFDQLKEGKILIFIIKLQ